MKLLSSNKLSQYNIGFLVKALLISSIFLFGTNQAQAKEGRIVSLGADVTEIIFALGASDHLVARDSTSTSPKEALSLPDVGYLRMLNTEGILAQKPDLILASEDAGPANVFAQLEAVNANIIRITAEKSIDSTREKIAQIGSALDLEEKAAILMNQFDEGLSQVATSPLNLSAIFILAFEGAEPSIAGINTAPDALFNYIGIKNAASELQRYQKFSAEGMIAMNPDVIVISKLGMDKLGSDNLWALPGIELTNAGKNRRLIVVDDNGFLGFSLQTPEVLRTFRVALESLE